MDARPESDLEALLRAHPITNGVIQLSILNEQWMCSIAHRQGHMTHSMGRFSADPVEAMRLALIEDERHDRECRRKYAGAAKVGVVEAVAVQQVSDDFDDLVAPTTAAPDDDDDFGSLAQPSVADTLTAAALVDDFEGLL